MTRKFKVLGLALFAVMALSALAAQGAQAAEFRCSSTPCVITGELHPQFNTTGGEHTDRFKVESGSGVTVECDAAKYEGTQPTSPSKTVTLTPTYGSTTAPSGCKASLGGEATVHTNHCAYVFSAATDAEEHGAVEVECSGTTENEILVTVPGAGETLHIAAQKPSGGVHYTNTETAGHKEITSHTTVKGIATTCTGIGCFFTGNATASYEGTETLKAYKDVGCTEATGTAKTTPSLASCEGEQINATYE
jgi:hypothetical protein